VWTWRAPTYGRTLLKGLQAYKGLLADGPAVVAGDFNSNAIWDRENPGANHSMAVELLAGCDLVSAYHEFFDEPHGQENHERATHYHGWKSDRPFHIDYCFVPRHRYSAVPADAHIA
jgi:endonuclease/exonuclease/phosphatase family metal-dependent hydrolase